MSEKLNKTLAIIGHPTRGKEVIQILEMLRGKNKWLYNGDKNTSIYFIQSSTRNISWAPIGAAYIPGNLFEVYTIDEFYTAFPYKVGNEVVFCPEGYHGAIKKISWNGFHKRIEYSFDEKYWYTAEELKLYKNNNYNIMEKINVAKLLKDCPQGMELDCTIFGTKVIYQRIYKTAPYPIVVQTEHGFEFRLTQYGQIHNIVGAECVIFPKGKTTWDEFTPPYQFKDGDIIYNQGIEAVAIFCKQTDDATISHCFLNILKELKIWHYHCKLLSDWRLATEDEKAKLFQAIKDNGYRWNPDTKTLEKLIEPVFKEGDRISLKCEDIYWDIKTIEGDWYICTNGAKIHIGEQHHYELVPNKFDITTLKPFDKVLFRMHDKDTWCNGFYGFYQNNHHFVNSFIITRHCIPYESNEHLLGTTNDCDDYYKTQ